MPHPHTILISPSPSPPPLVKPTETLQSVGHIQCLRFRPGGVDTQEDSVIYYMWAAVLQCACPGVSWVRLPKNHQEPQRSASRISVS